MRDLTAYIFILLIIALGACALTAKRSRKAIGTSVAFLTGSLLLPVIGNLIIISSSTPTLPTIGYYIYFLGMDFTIISLLRFTFDYCSLKWPNKGLKLFVYGLFGVDFLQYVFNPFLKQAFDTEAIMAYGYPYYRLVPHLGQTFHRVLDYGILAAVIIIFFVKTVKCPRIDAERYFVILVTLILTSLWQTFFIFSRTPVDRSMTGMGCFGILIFYLALFYRPLRLLDQMLANSASDMPEALYFFDASGQCIWANAPGIKLADIDEKYPDQANEKLVAIFGHYEKPESSWTAKHVIGSGNDAKYYVLEKREVRDNRDRVTGSFLSIRDNTAEQLHFQQELYNTTHDNLTGLYTKEYLYYKIRELILNNPSEEYMIIFVDVKNFKIVNDVFGTAFGDYAIQRIAEWIQNRLCENGVCGRLAGDTFGVCLPVRFFDELRIEKSLADFEVTKDTLFHHVLIHLGV